MHDKRRSGRMVMGGVVLAAIAGLVLLMAAPRPTPAAAEAAPTVAPADAAGLPSASPAAPEVRAPCASTAVACVQLSTQHVWLIRDGTVTRDGFISSGATDMETPTGTFHVQYKVKDQYSTEYQTPMPYSVFFDTRGDALHEGSLARQSAGCVHLVHEDAVAFYEALSPGDEIQILP